ncbi:MAG: nicotinate-nucleotide adenylyltransferase [Chloroflexota bacterium]|nr:nicotinate-nucleotide adenylyltransferase [Chloroflexota bacterium]MDE2968672.1 nicotinate-nucleotide adenylyltransferase [Chloroflexota bacterium]
MKLGILGGTFDPIHLGHMAAAEAALGALSLDRILFIPAGDPWLKAGTEVSPGAHRLAMVRAAIAGDDAYESSTMELDRAGPTYTEETLAELQEAYGPAADLHFILGADAVRDLPRWHAPADVLARCTLVVMGRPAQGELDLAVLDGILPGSAARAVSVDLDMGVSATEIRRRAAEGESLAGLVPEDVERYIVGHGLYVEYKERQ